MEKWRAKAGSGVETGPEGLELAAVMTIIIRDADSRKKMVSFQSLGVVCRFSRPNNRFKRISYGFLFLCLHRFLESGIFSW